jgi:Raf kinase inhibitor-like YbhB/YbcL family protein
VKWVLAAVFSAAVVAGAAGASRGGFVLRTPAFAPGGTIPVRYTCAGANVSPPLRWGHVPRATRSLALSVVDRDAPGGSFTHWLAWGIRRSARSVTAGVRLRLVGMTSAGGIGYTGPCPPPGAAHHYVFRLYALRSALPLRRGATRARFDAALKGRVLRVATLVGRYGR